MPALTVFMAAPVCNANTRCLMAKPGLTRKRFLLRTAIVVGLLSWAYVAGYARLYYRGTREIDCANTNAFFFYVPLADVAAERGIPVQHMLAFAFYAPVNHLHRAWFRAYPPCSGMSFGLSRDSVPRSTEL